jgi:hypothetical protein
MFELTEFAACVSAAPSVLSQTLARARLYWVRALHPVPVLQHFAVERDPPARSDFAQALPARLPNGHGEISPSINFASACLYCAIHDLIFEQHRVKFDPWPSNGPWRGNGFGFWRWTDGYSIPNEIKGLS